MERGHLVRMSAQREQRARTSNATLSVLRTLADRMSALHTNFILAEKHLHSVQCISNCMNTTTPTALLRLLQLSDTALPIGALNHSFGLETLVAEESLSADGLDAFLHDYLHEVCAFELHFCGAAYRLGIEPPDRFPVE